MQVFESLISFVPLLITPLQAIQVGLQHEDYDVDN